MLGRHFGLEDELYWIRYMMTFDNSLSGKTCGGIINRQDAVTRRVLDGDLPKTPDEEIQIRCGRTSPVGA